MTSYFLILTFLNIYIQFSFPCKRKAGGKAGEIEIVKDFEIDATTQSLIDLTLEELVSEKEAAINFLDTTSASV